METARMEIHFLSDVFVGGRHRRGILNSLLFYLFCFYFLFLYNLILLFLIGNTCTEMVILNKLVLVIAIIIC